MSPVIASGSAGKTRAWATRRDSPKTSHAIASKATKSGGCAKSECVARRGWRSGRHEVARGVDHEGRAVPVVRQLARRPPDGERVCPVQATMARRSRLALDARRVLRARHRIEKQRRPRAMQQSRLQPCASSRAPSSGESSSARCSSSAVLGVGLYRAAPRTKSSSSKFERLVQHDLKLADDAEVSCSA